MLFSNNEFKEINIRNKIIVLNKREIKVETRNLKLGIIIVAIIIALEIVSIIIIKNKICCCSIEDETNLLQETFSMMNSDDLESESVSLELFEEYYPRAEEIMKDMSIEEKVGQMFLVRYPEIGANEEIINLNPGGYILFAKDFKEENKDSIIQKINTNQANAKIKMFMAVDEEGGTVCRVSLYSAFRECKFKSPQELWAEGGTQKILDDSREKSKLLKSLGINMNLAPVVDVTTNPQAFIYNRTLGREAKDTAQFATVIIKQMNIDNIISCMKHFPGYGDNVDTHTGIAIDEREYIQFKFSDFLPFISGIENEAPTIMVNHNIVKCMDEKFPASISEEVHNILRNELGFSGLIITDDLSMEAMKNYVIDGKAAVQAIKAGNDIIISSDFRNQRNEVINALNNEEFSIDLINVAVKRILACKLKYGIIE